jgi:Uma2 family endonuclease
LANNLSGVAESEVRVPHFNALRLRQFSVPEYQRLVESGVLGLEPRVELLEGWIVNKMTINPPHAAAVTLATALIMKLLPTEWILRIQSPIETADSQPEPDFAVARGTARNYIDRHPRPQDIGLLIEISDSTLEDDRDEMGRIYARAQIPVYWIINLRDRIIEVHTMPKRGKKPLYANRQVFQKADKIPLLLDGVIVAEIPVADLLP